MKVIYLSENSDITQKVYNMTEKVFSKKDVLSNPDAFRDTEFIFSTWEMPTFSVEEIKEFLPSLKAVFYAAGSVQFFARPFLNCGVKIFSAWTANAVPVAEYTVAQILLSNVSFFKTMRYTDHAKAREIFGKFPGNYGAKVGIIGAGTIGKLVIEKLKGYDLEVLVFDAFLSDQKAQELGVKKCDLETLFSQCNVVSNHLANNDETKGMLNKTLFDKMLPFSTFLNTGRGAQVVEGDLIAFLKERPDVTAILDVTEPEPPEENSELYTLENCILTPHIAGSWGLEIRRMGEYMRNEYECLINNQPTKYEVTLEMLKTMA
jgi:phosphoglycerate dehydrogenase-like enzyme